MKISRITETKQGRFALFDEAGEFVFSVDGETLAKNKLTEGTALTADALSCVQAQSDTRRAKDKALSYLSLRDYASGELYEKLRQKFDEHSAAAAVAEMQRLGLVNDENFARHRAKYLAGQNRSAREIRQKLAQKGIDREMAEQAVEALAHSDEDACYALLQKSYLKKLAAGETQKVLAALARRGFSYGAAKAAIARCNVQAPDEETEFFD